MLLEDVIRSAVALLFPGQTILEAAIFRLLRDSELELDDEGGRTYLEAVEAELRKRRRSDVVRLEVEQQACDEPARSARDQLERDRPRTSIACRAAWICACCSA